MNAAWRVARWLWTIAAIALLAWYGHRAWTSIASSPDAAGAFAPARLLGAGALFALHLALAAMAWWSLVRPLAPAGVGWRESLRHFVLPMPAKYVPGSVWQLVGRAQLLDGAGFPRGVAIAAVLAEQILVVSSASLLAIVGLVAFGARAFDSLLAWVAFALVAAVVVLAVMARALRARVAALRGRRGWWRLFAPAFAWTVASHLVFLGAYAVCVTSWQDPSPRGVLAFLAIVMTATVAGLLTPIAPGGIGVREAGIVLLSGSAALVGPMPVDPAHATLAAALSRLVLIAVEFIAFVIVRADAARATR